MAWDLAKAMAKKGEFEFRQRARTFRLMAEARGEEPATLVALIAQKSDEAILEELAARDGKSLDELRALHERCGAEARKQLIAERGDPTPYRLL